MSLIEVKIMAILLRCRKTLVTCSSWCNRKKCDFFTTFHLVVTQGANYKTYLM